MFRSTQYLGTALALKTLILALLAGPAVIFIRKFGLFNSLIASQAVGIVFLGLTALGFSQNNFVLVLIGSTLSAVPSVFLGIITSVNLKMLSGDSDTFRKNQSVIGTAGSSGFLFAAISVPFLNTAFHVNSILFIDALTYLAGIFVLVAMGGEFKSHINTARSESASLIPNQSNFQKARSFITQPSARLFIIAASSVLIFRGLAPILAGARDFGLYSTGNLDLKQFFWSLEAAAGIMAGLIYYRVRSKAHHLKILFLLNGIACVPMMISPSISTFAISILALSILMSFGFQYFRDSLMIAHTTESDLDKAAGTASFVFGIILTVSPVIITAGTRVTTLNNILFAVFFIQIVLFTFYFRRKNLSDKIETS